MNGCRAGPRRPRRGPRPKKTGIPLRSRPRQLDRGNPGPTSLRRPLMDSRLQPPAPRNLPRRLLRSREEDLLRERHPAVHRGKRRGIRGVTVAFQVLSGALLSGFFVVFNLIPHRFQLVSELFSSALSVVFKCFQNCFQLDSGTVFKCSQNCFQLDSSLRLSQLILVPCRNSW